ncbi:hypothetical protein [Caenibius sp. WL]|uniref:hypothetical protein n=1 Tax=Caenibius sp. WL TaxID=2872646 RepID=UPI001C99447A|nr:hypothetical protein [Caenibius sp. WL]QZP07799.1 hypothetical protein K5X80_14270 [Caenibius sp. WL]QZP09969.1 hypothetical protein K5X80_16935 [Caenibius sp. WL]
MDWQEIKEALCASRDFTPVHDGVRVLADTMMPSGLLIHIHIQMRDGLLFMHDNGAAFDELSQHGKSFPAVGHVRRLLTETGFRLTPEGEIFRDRIKLNDVGIGVALVADASLRAAQYMLAHSKVRVGQPLDVRVRDALRQRFPEGTPNFKFTGHAKQQTFDFGIEQDGEVILVDAVSPDSSSVNAAIVKSLDVVRAQELRARPILVYDERDGWTSDAMNLLGMAAGERMSFARVSEGRLLAA